MSVSAFPSPRSSTGCSVTIGGPEGGRPYYGPARIAGGLILIGLVVVLSIMDSFRSDYALDSVVLGLLLGTGVGLLGVEFGRRKLDE